MPQPRPEAHHQAPGVGTFRRDGDRYRLTAGVSPQGTWTLVSAPATARLRPGVRGYRGYRLDLDCPQRRVEIPTGAVSMVFSFGDPLRIARLPAAGTAQTGPDWAPHTSLATGLQTQATLGEHNGRISGVEVLLEPWMAYTVFDTAMHDIQGRIMHLTDVLGSEGGLIEEQLAGALTWSARFTLLDTFLLARHARGRRPAGQVVHAWKHLARSTGREPISHIAESVGWSERHLELRFREQIGLPPRRVARLTRLRRSLRLLAAGHPAVRVAADCDFYDQAHFNRDFKAVVGCTPTELVAYRAHPLRPVDRFTGQPTSALLARA